VEIRSLVVGPFQENCYILTDGNADGVVIDPGADAQRIIQVLGQDNISSILLSHAHIDHIGAVAAVQKHTGARIGLSDKETGLLKGAAVQASLFGLPAPESFKIDFFLSDHLEIPLGRNHITVLATPGHSPGGVSFLVAGRVFVGDALFYDSIGRTDLPGGSSDQLLRSIRDKLLSLEDDTIVCPGHGRETTIGREKRHNPFLLHF